jgi:hypothetical protein
VSALEKFRKDTSTRLRQEERSFGTIPPVFLTTGSAYDHAVEVNTQVGTFLDYVHAAPFPMNPVHFVARNESRLVTIVSKSYPQGSTCTITTVGYQEHGVELFHVMNTLDKPPQSMQASIPTYRRYALKHDATNPSLAPPVDPALDPEIVATLKEYEKLTEKNWDGYGAEPISKETIAYARRLLRIMPVVFGPPDISPGADGSIALEWHPTTGSVRKLFLDIGPGEEWSAYWKRRTGEFQRMPGYGFGDATKRILQSLFDDLSK